MNRILLIDDDAIFLKIAKLAISRKLSGVVEVHTAINLTEIEQKMEEDYDIILIDLNMPEITGWQVIDRYKEKLKSPSCTAIICSSSIDPRDLSKAAEMNDVIEKMISKPIDVDLIKAYLPSAQLESR